MMRSWTCCNGSNPLGSLSSAPALREDPGGCESADHPKIARTAEGGACSNYLFGSGFASLGHRDQETDPGPPLFRPRHTCWVAARCSPLARSRFSQPEPTEHVRRDVARLRQRL